MSDVPKVLRGSIFYFVRQIVVLCLQILTNFYILKWISPKEFGLFATLNIFLGLLQVLFEGGISVYIIHKQKVWSNNELSNFLYFQLASYFFFQIILIFFAILIPGDFVKFISIITVAIPFAIIRSIAFAQIEKNLRFGEVSLIEMTESVVYTLTVLFFASIGLGIKSLVIGVIIKSIIGCIFTVYYSPLKLTPLKISFTDQIKKAYKFGLEFHSPTLLNSIRLLANPTINGYLFSMAYVGFYDRAVYIAGLPLFIIGAVQQKILFPYYSKNQNSKEISLKIFSVSYQITNIVDKLLYIPLIITIEFLIPNYFPEWKDVIPYFRIYLIGNLLFGSFFFSTYPLLNANGKSRDIAKLSILTTILTWILIIPAGLIFKSYGYPLLSILIWIVGIYPMLVASSKIIGPFQHYKEFLTPILAFSIAYTCTYYFSVDTMIMVILKILLTLFVYTVLLIWMNGNIIREILKDKRIRYIWKI